MNKNSRDVQESLWTFLDGFCSNQGPGTWSWNWSKSDQSYKQGTGQLAESEGCVWNLGVACGMLAGQIGDRSARQVHPEIVDIEWQWHWRQSCVICIDGSCWAIHYPRVHHCSKNPFSSLEGFVAGCLSAENAVVEGTEMFAHQNICSIYAQCTGWSSTYFGVKPMARCNATV